MRDLQRETVSEEECQSVLRDQLDQIHRQTDRTFAFLLMAQWAFCIVCAIMVAPNGHTATVIPPKVALAAAMGIGGLLTVIPCAIVFLAPGRMFTRMILAVAQVMFSSLIIYLTGGRIESHFHIFGSLAFLAFYRDRWVFLPPVLLVALDHLVRGQLLSGSLLGANYTAPWQALELAGWVMFEVAFLLVGVAQSRKQLAETSRLQCSLTMERDLLERRVLERTCEIESSRDFYRAINDSLNTHICILDVDGKIIDTNASWKEYAYECGADLATAGIGASYHAMCRDTAGILGDQAVPLSGILRDIIAGKRKSFVGEFPCHGSDEPRWFLIRACSIPRDRNGGAVVVAHVDVTSRVRALEEVQKQKKQADVLALVAQNTDDSVVVTDENACVEWINAGFTQQTGRGLDEVKGTKLTELGRGPLTDLMTVREIQRAIDHEHGYDAEIVNYTKSGERYWASIELRPIRNAEGRLTRFICIERDITETKKASKSLRQAKLQAEVVAEERDRQRLLLESILLQIPTAVYWKDRHGLYLGCNQAFASYAGLTCTSEIVGLSDQQLPWTPDQAEALSTGDAGIFRTGQGQSNVERDITDAAGVTHTVLTSKTALINENNTVIGLLGSFHDISELKAAESSAVSLGHAIRKSPNEVFIADAKTFEFVEVNQAACDDLGYTREELFKMSPLDIITAFTPEEFQSKVGPIAEGETDRMSFETIHRRKDGTIYPVHANLNRAVYMDRDVVVAFVTDLTEQKQLEAQLAQAQKLESIGQLAAGIAHEINTPMQCVSGNVEFLMECYGRLFTVVDALCGQLFGPDKEDWNSRREELIQITKDNRYEHIRRQAPIAIEEAAQATRRITSIVRAMKTMSHPGSMDKTDTDINELVQSVVTISRARWKYTADLELDLGENIPMLPLLATSVSQVFINMIVNAADAIAEKLGEKPKELGHICIKTEHVDNGVNFIIHDDGIGMDEETQRRIFDPFFTTKEVGKGTGQGMSISYDAIVMKHGGQIDVQSTPGQGTRMTVFLPSEPTTGYLDSNTHHASKPEANHDQAAMPLIELDAPTTQAPASN